MPTLPERVSKPLVLIWVLLALCLPRVGIASPIFAVGDVHGAYQELLSVLTTAQLVDENENWRGGSARLVSVGDLVDRGADSRKVMDLFRRLQDQAADAGGAVHVLLGNHEVMNLRGDVSDVSDAEFASYATPNEVPDEAGKVGVAGHREAFSASGVYGSWLRTLPAAVQLDGILFMHGGLSPLMAGKTIEQINAAVHLALDAPPTQPDEPEPEIIGELGPVWYRGNALCHELLEVESLTALLDGLGVQRIVLGHTPTRTHEIVSRFDGRVVLIDTGMLASVYGGQPRLLKVDGDKISAISADGKTNRVNKQVDDAMLEAQLLAATNPQEVGAAFVPLKRRQANAALAAYRLDRALGFNFVPPTVVKPFEGKEGIWLAGYGASFSELTRQAKERFRPNNCAQGTAYDLLAALDSLLGLVRTGEDIRYDPLWRILAFGNERAFTGSSKIPKYNRQPALPKLLQDRLAQLDLAMLEGLVGEGVKPRALKALLKRRDRLLEWPTIGAAD